MQVRVLVVDDTDHVRSMLADMLDIDGFEVVGQAASGPEAIELARTTTPHVVVMDYKMPGMDGLTAARAIKEENATLPIIIYTAYLDPDLEEQARESGVAMTVGKVEGLNQLERHITDLCRDLSQT